MKLAWFRQQRIDFIAEALRVFGFVNRRHLEVKFGISTPQASNDIATFLRLKPRAMSYDARRKCYMRLL